ELGRERCADQGDRRDGDGRAQQPRPGRLCALRLGLPQLPRGQGLRGFRRQAGERARVGEMFTGIVTDLGRVRTVSPGAITRFDVLVPAALARFIAAKGSVTLDGVSLTVNEVEGERFGVNIIPVTQRQTNFGVLWPGDRVNLEIDLVARYLARLLQKDPA